MRTEAMKARYERLKAEGICPNCLNPNDSEFTRCNACRTVYKQYAAKRYQKEKQNSICHSCRQPLPPQKGHVLCTECRSDRSAYKRSQKARDSCRRWAWNLKKLIVEQYGGQCVTCGETRLPILDLDHINNDGYQHRRDLGLPNNISGSRFYAKLIKEQIFPDSLQLLCSNCHRMKHAEGWEKYI